MVNDTNFDIVLIENSGYKFQNFQIIMINLKKLLW